MRLNNHTIGKKNRHDREKGPVTPSPGSHGRSFMTHRHLHISVNKDHSELIKSYDVAYEHAPRGAGETSH